MSRTDPSEELRMRMDDLILVSIDDHVVEPGTMFDGRLPARFRDRAPKLVRDAAGWRIAAIHWSSRRRAP